MSGASRILSFEYAQECVGNRVEAYERSRPKRESKSVEEFLPAKETLNPKVLLAGKGFFSLMGWVFGLLTVKINAALLQRLIVRILT